ncbi:Cullin repeat-like-containing domain protein [Phellopilus nigrolimitatus]|nr:Cullin repeat-like-containing domain protein [Phellopilus nigrolimitatus]
MEDEAAEIELLEQNLNKTRQISQRMISILTSFDTRLVKLEKSILPLHNSTQLLNRRAANIEGTLQVIDEVASSQQGLAVEEALILRGPQATQLNAYIDALERINASIAFKGTSGDSGDSARLVEAGAKKLAQLYTKLVAEASSGTPPARSSFDTDPSVILVPFPEDIVKMLNPLVSFIRTLPLPATHPSHPAAISIQTALTDAQRGYADMRGTWIRRCLESDAKRVVEGHGDGYASGKDIDAATAGIREGQEFGIWVEGVIDNEYNLLARLALLPSTPQLTGAYASLITPLLTLLSSSLGQLTMRVKRALQRNTFLALSAHSHLAGADVMGRWDETVKRRASGSTANVNVLKEGVHSLRAVCLRSFPEFLVDIKSAAVPSAGGEVGTDVAEITETVLKYMKAIPAVQIAVGTSLLTLGDGNWKMGEGVQVSKGPKLGEGDESVIIEHYFYDIIMTTLSTLTTLSRSARRPAYGAIFLLNNVSYFLSALLFSPSDSAVPVEALLAPPARNALQSGFRTAKAGYFDANFSPLLQALGDGPGAGGGSGKAGVKEKFTRFFELFDDIVERHRIVRVLPDDEQNRESLAEEAVKLVIPSLQRFIQKNKDFSKSKSLL